MTALCFVEGDEEIVTGDGEGVLRLWSLENESEALVELKTHDSKILAVSWIDREAERVLSVLGWYGKVCEVSRFNSSWETQCRDLIPAELDVAAFSNSGRMQAVGFEDGKVAVLDQAGRTLWTSPDERAFPLTSIDISERAKLLLLAGEKKVRFRKFLSRLDNMMKRAAVTEIRMAVRPQLETGMTSPGSPSMSIPGVFPRITLRAREISRPVRTTNTIGDVSVALDDWMRTLG